MNKKEILLKVDHTLLKPTATTEEIEELCQEAIKYGTATVCIPPCHVLIARKHKEQGLKICTVVGFPNGYSSPEAKCFEASDAVAAGADEVDMVINIGKLKEKDYGYILNEINSIKRACNGRLLKVIIETCLLTKEEIIKMCEIVDASNADFIKTSTGFSTGGATFEDVKLMRKHIGRKKIKAAGGISSLEDAEEFIRLGAERLGTSKIVKIIKSEQKEE